jgi:quercetin dioxygenase-like cupin family protein
VGTLLRISDALGIGLPTLVEAPAPHEVRVTRRDEGAVLWRGPAGGRGVLVAGTQPPDVLELWDWTLAAGEEHRSEAHAAGTRELLQVQEGRVAVHVGDRSVTLAAGDAVGFAGDVDHGYAHVDGVPARFTLTVFEPGVVPASHSGGAHG